MEDKSILRRKIKSHIESIETPTGIYDLFKNLNYSDNIIFDSSYIKKINQFHFVKEEKEKIKNIYTIMSYDKLNVFLIETASLTKPHMRYIANKFAEMYTRCLLILTIDYKEIHIVFPDYEKKEVGKHKLKTTTLILKKDELYYTDIEIICNLFLEDHNKSWREIWRLWKEAFNVQKVTEKFFEDYKRIFLVIRKELKKQKIDMKIAHEFTLQFLNRIMFIYFIAKKEWLNKNRKFMQAYWDLYKRINKYGNNAFYDKWLKPMFFEAFNNKSNYYPELPEEVNRILSNCPYLNGGLFTQKAGLDDLRISMPDSLFKEVFDFFESYNFTIKEDSVLDVEVSVDPQMIGYVYESLANIREDIYENEDDLRGEWGIFYTARIEVDFMCRISLIEYLRKNLEIPKEELYEFVFDEDKEKIEKKFNQRKCWVKIEDTLDNLSIVDPACGSGAFLVGMLNVLVELYKVVYKHLGSSLSDFQLKYRIIQHSLYGVDVMPWAIHASELRLWLQLIVETRFNEDELRKHPLLPNLNMNLCVGDSLVQEIGGISFNVRNNNLKPYLKKKLEELENEKRRYFENSPSAKYKTLEEFKAQGIRLFEEILNERIELLETDIQVLSNSEKKKEKQTGLFGTSVNIDAENIKTENEKSVEIEERIKECNYEIEKLKRVKELLKDPAKKPFVWDIDFAEVFGDKGGFDIVIGNPPYVRFQKIMPPNELNITSKEKAEYKEKLIKSVCDRFRVIKDFNKKSDLYLYFYFHGLSLLNQKGILCFITSNSWLDVEYGKNLQEFLLKYVKIYAIYDNLAKKSFEHADVNTVITLLGSPIILEQRTLVDFSFEINGKMGTNFNGFNHFAKFVMFKKPFEEVISSKNLIDIDNVNLLTFNDYFRVTPKKQEELFVEGLNENKRYDGIMWGGRYLRSPDIFLKISDNNKSLVHFGSIVKIETYLNTLGADDFFFVSLVNKGKLTSRIKSRISEKVFEIENDFLIDFIESPKELSSITIAGNFKTKLFRPPFDKKMTKDMKANDYLKMGSLKRYKTELPRQAYNGRKMIMACYQGANHTVYYNPNEIISHRFFRIIPQNQEESYIIKLCLVLNSTFCSLSMESFRNPSLGGGVLAHGAYTMKEFILPSLDKIRFDLNKFSKFLNRPILTIMEEIGINPAIPIREQEPKPLPDRVQLDNIIFDELGLTKEERKEVYWAVCELVQQRLGKAMSLKK